MTPLFIGWYVVIAMLVTMPLIRPLQAECYRLASNVFIAASCIVFAIQTGSFEGTVWVLNAVLFAALSGDSYWKVFHAEADQESKWAWREWQNEQYEKQRERYRRLLTNLEGRL